MPVCWCAGTYTRKSQVSPGVNGAMKFGIKFLKAELNLKNSFSFVGPKPFTNES
jgi:hypothetical protein